MAKNKHTFAKRQRELKKAQKAEEKREKRRLKALGIDPNATDESEDGEKSAEDESGETDPVTEPNAEAIPEA